MQLVYLSLPPSVQRSKGHPYRFTLLVRELRGAETQEYLACVLALINCILSACGQLSRRVKFRNEFIGERMAMLLTGYGFAELCLNGD